MRLRRGYSGTLESAVIASRSYLGTGRTRCRQTSQLSPPGVSPGMTAESISPQIDYWHIPHPPETGADQMKSKLARLLILVLAGTGPSLCIAGESFVLRNISLIDPDNAGKVTSINILITGSKIDTWALAIATPMARRVL